MNEPPRGVPAACAQPGRDRTSIRVQPHCCDGNCHGICTNSRGLRALLQMRLSVCSTFNKFMGKICGRTVSIVIISSMTLPTLTVLRYDCCDNCNLFPAFKRRTWEVDSRRPVFAAHYGSHSKASCMLHLPILSRSLTSSENSQTRYLMTTFFSRLFF